MTSAFTYKDDFARGSILIFIFTVLLLYILLHVRGGGGILQGNLANIMHIQMQHKKVSST
jgi:hypothetical protein